jgi:hypothetical protein
MVSPFQRLLCLVMCIQEMLYKLLAFIFRTASGSNCHVCEFVADDASMVPEMVQAHQL